MVSLRLSLEKTQRNDAYYAPALSLLDEKKGSSTRKRLSLFFLFDDDDDDDERVFFLTVPERQNESAKLQKRKKGRQGSNRETSVTV